MNRAEVTDADRSDFRRWLKESKSRYEANKGKRERPTGLREDHSKIVTGSGKIGNELREAVPLALAALVLDGKAESDPVGFLSPWVGSHTEIAELAQARLENERDEVQRYAVVGLWCENDGCRRGDGRRRFIRPVALRRATTPTSTFATTAVCAKCHDVTVIWMDNDGVWVRSVADLREHNHPMHPRDIYDWVARVRPPTDREARFIVP